MNLFEGGSGRYTSALSNSITACNLQVIMGIIIAMKDRNWKVRTIAETVDNEKSLEFITFDP